MTAPVVYPLLAVMAGTFLGWCFPRQPEIFLWGLLFGTTAVLIPFLAMRRAAWTGLLFLAPLVLLSALRISIRLTPDLPPEHLAHQAGEKPILLEGVVCGPPGGSTAFTRIPFRARRIHSADGTRDVVGKTELFVADRVSGIETGDRLIAETRIRPLRRAGNPGEPDRRSRSFLNRIYVRGYVRGERHLLRLGTNNAAGVQPWIQSVRNRLSAFFNKEKDPAARGLVKACILGDRTGLPESTREAFRCSGLAHLLAISGLHVGLVGLFVYAGLKRVLNRSQGILLRGWVQKGAAVCSLPVVLFYVILAGSPVTAVRATAMALLFIGSLLLDRAHAVWNTLGWAALVILLSDPSALFSISFLLSFSAVAALLTAVPLLRTPFRESKTTGGSMVTSLTSLLKRRLLQFFLASTAVSLATAPLTALFFNRITPLAVLGNLVVVPLVGWLVVPLGLVAGLVALLSVSAAQPLLWFAGLAAHLAVEAAHAFSNIPGACIRTGDPNLPEVGLFYCALFLFLRRKGSVWRRRLFFVCVALLLSVLAAGILKPRWSRHLEVSFLSVGDGDCMVIEFPGGKRMMLDGGMARQGSFDTGRRIAIPFLGRRRICRIDYLAVSHGQSDHYGGLRILAEQFRPRELWIAPETGLEESGYRDFLNDCTKRGIRIRRMCRKTRPFTLHGARIEVLHPPCAWEIDFHQSAGQESRHINNRSLVVRVTFGAASFLFTGDIENEAEEMLANQDTEIGAFLLKVPHHGSRSSSSRGFLDRVNPHVAVVSAGGGTRFGFPSGRVVDLYAQRGISLFRTDRDGAVQVLTDGSTVHVRSYWGREETYSLRSSRD